MLICQKHQFSLDPTIHYLNNAAYGPLPNLAAAAAQVGIAAKVSPHTKRPDDHFETADIVRGLFAQLVNAQYNERIAIIPSVSYGMATVAANLHRLPNIYKKRTIVILENEFPNDTYAFERVSVELNLTAVSVRKPIGQTIGKTWNETILSAIDESTAMVVLPHVHWIEGIVFDLVEIGTKCREMGALLIIDGTQSVGALPFDVQKIKPDAVICGAYKWLLGPYAVGLAYYGEFFDDGVPIEETWMNRLQSNDFTNLTNLQPEYRPMAQRYNMGEFSQFIQLPMLEASLRLLLEWGVDNIQNYVQNLTLEPIQSLMGMGCKIEDSVYRASHLFSVKFPASVSIEKLGDSLAASKVYVSKRGDGMRVSANVFNDANDFEALLKVIAIIKNM